MLQDQILQTWKTPPKLDQRFLTAFFYSALPAPIVIVIGVCLSRVPKRFAGDGFWSLDIATNTLVNQINSFYFYAISRETDYTISRYAINRTIFLEKDRLSFMIYNSYAIKHTRIVRLSNKQLTWFICLQSSISKKAIVPNFRNSPITDGMASNVKN